MTELRLPVVMKGRNPEHEMVLVGSTSPDLEPEECSCVYSTQCKVGSLI